MFNKFYSLLLSSVWPVASWLILVWSAGSKRLDSTDLRHDPFYCCLEDEMAAGFWNIKSEDRIQMFTVNYVTNNSSMHACERREALFTKEASCSSSRGMHVDRCIEQTPQSKTDNEFCLQKMRTTTILLQGHSFTSVDALTGSCIGGRGWVPS